jgi:hypothetical protein
MNDKQGKPYWIVDESGRKLVYNGTPIQELVPATEENTPAWLWDKMKTVTGLCVVTIQPTEDKDVLKAIERILTEQGQTFDNLSNMN